MHKHILIPTDGSGLSNEAIQYGTDIAKAGILDNKDLMRLLRLEVKQAGGQSSWARRARIDRTMLNRVLNGRKPLTKEII